MIDYDKYLIPMTPAEEGNGALVGGLLAASAIGGAVASSIKNKHDQKKFDKEQSELSPIYQRVKTKYGIDFSEMKKSYQNKKTDNTVFKPNIEKVTNLFNKLISDLKSELSKNSKNKPGSFDKDNKDFSGWMEIQNVTSENYDDVCESVYSAIKRFKEKHSDLFTIKVLDVETDGDANGYISVGLSIKISRFG